MLELMHKDDEFASGSFLAENGAESNKTVFLGKIIQIIPNLKGAVPLLKKQWKHPQ